MNRDALLRSRLAGLAADVLADVADALALVGLGRPDVADLGGHLADQFLVDAFDLAPASLFSTDELDPLRAP